MTLSRNKKTARIVLPSLSVNAGKELLANGSRYIDLIWHWLQKQQESLADGCVQCLEKTASFGQIMTLSRNTKTTRIASPSLSVNAGKYLLAKASRYIDRIWHWLQKKQEVLAAGWAQCLEKAASFGQIKKISRNMKTTCIALPSLSVNAGKDLLAKASRFIDWIWHWLRKQQEALARWAQRLEKTASFRQIMTLSRNKKTTRIAPRTLSANAGKDFLANALRHLGRIWHWLQERQKARAAERSLRLEETVSLGQKRFVAVVKVDGQRFLIGVGTSEISMLATLQPETSFAHVLQESTAVEKSANAIHAKLSTTAIGATQCA